MEGMMSNMNTVNRSVKDIQSSGISFPSLYKETCQCCPPEPECPPHCIATINRVAAQGERILVPFMIKNSSKQAKTYRIGVRELKDQDGKLAPAQPQLNKTSVTLDAGRSERVVMMIDLSQFDNGLGFATEIVIREKDINQNICFNLKIDNDHQLVTATPKDEQNYKKRWQSWQSHYYCDVPDKKRPGAAIIKI
jgi:hypothetical protein